MKIEYKESLRSNFTKNYIEIEYDETRKQYVSIYLYNYAHGTISVTGGRKEVHRWESEDEAESVSYISRRYTTVILNGAPDDPETEGHIIQSISDYIDAAPIPPKDREIISGAFDYIKLIK